MDLYRITIYFTKRNALLNMLTFHDIKNSKNTSWNALKTVFSQQNEWNWVIFDALTKSEIFSELGVS